MDRIQTKYLEAREFFRINDRLDLTYRLIEPNELETPNYSFDIAAVGENHELLKAMQILNKHSNEMLNNIAEDNIAVANYLRLIEHKIMLLTKSIIYKVDATKVNPRLTNLSETGIAFGAKESFAINDYLRVTLVLQPVFSEIAIYGKVIRIEPSENIRTADPEYRFWIAMSFTHAQNADKQILARYILHKQAVQRQGKENI